LEGLTFLEKRKPVLQYVDFFGSFCIIISKGVVKMPELEALSKRVKVYRKYWKKSQFDLAYDMGISVEELSLIERKLTDPKLSTLQKIAAYMGITVSKLLETEKDVNNASYG
jgi:DNA-binding XRE family transcriptional regulator